MTENYYPHIEIFGESKKRLHSGLDLYESSVSCNRCGACARICLSYQINKQETRSPRGRNQLLRLIFENKIKLYADKKIILPCVTTCLQCGRCTSLCSAAVPTALHMREILRCYDMERPSLSLKFFTASHNLFFALKTRGVKLPAVAKPQAVFAPDVFTVKNLKAALKIIQDNTGEAAVLKTALLLPYNAAYNTLPAIGNLLRKIKAEFDLTAKGQNIPLITDSITIYRLLKNSKEFDGVDIRFITDILKDAKEAAQFKNKRITLLPNFIFNPQNGETENIIKKLNCGRNDFLIEFNKEQLPALGLAAYGHSAQHKKIRAFVKKQIKKDAPDILVTIDGADWRYIKKLLKKENAIKVLHITELAAIIYDD